MIWLALITLLICAFTLLFCLWNLWLLGHAPSSATDSPSTSISICIPARNEAERLPALLYSLQAQTHQNFDVWIYDDESTDGTSDIVRSFSEEDARFKSAPTQPLPDGFNGKQFACSQLAQHGTGHWLLFIDADVQLHPECLRRTLLFAEKNKTDLVSLFPRQRTLSFGEILLIPLIHFLLMSYLPLSMMRRTQKPAAAAGCGQFMFITQEAYLASGGHAGFPDSMHDGVKLPRAVRSAGFKTDLTDGTDLATCRMYEGLADSVAGFVKNAYEGLGSVSLLLFVTAIHLIGHVLPWVILIVALGLGEGGSVPAVLSASAIACQLIQRAALAWRFRLHPLSIILHPLAILAMTLIQWKSFLVYRRGQRSWRGRDESTASQPTAS